MLCIHHGKECGERALETQGMEGWFGLGCRWRRKAVDYTTSLHLVSHFPALSFTILLSFLKIIHDYKVLELILVLCRQAKKVLFIIPWIYRAVHNLLKLSAHTVELVNEYMLIRLLFKLALCLRHLKDKKIDSEVTWLTQDHVLCIQQNFDLNPGFLTKFFTIRLCPSSETCFKPQD